MKNKLILFLFLFAATNCLAQSDKEERKQDILDNADEKKTITKEKVDYNLFHRQMIALKEYAEERKKIPTLQKVSKMPVKILTSIDSIDETSDESKVKTITGYITENVGDNSVNVYEVIYDRTQKKIVSVKATGESSDLEQEDAGDNKTGVKKANAKKKNTDDDEDDDNNPKKKIKDKDDD